ncbi:MAG: hypothetical protein MUC28_01710, partial [Planctomycetes bacterium]|nr:hypothetical protein [Planctomycetota bacterium]
MAVYRYKALNKEKQVIQGLVEAPSEKQAIEILKEKEYAIISLKIKSAGGGGKLNFSFGKIKPKDMVVFSRQFSVLIS